MLFWSKKALKRTIKELRDEEEVKKIQDSCDHHWVIYGSDLLGKCHCFHCGKRVDMYVALNDLFEKTQHIVKEYELSKQKDRICEDQRLGS